MAAESAGDPFDALSDPQRRRILSLLKDADRSVQELADSPRSAGRQCLATCAC